MKYDGYIQECQFLQAFSYISVVVGIQVCIVHNKIENYKLECVLQFVDRRTNGTQHDFAKVTTLNSQGY